MLVNIPYGDAVIESELPEGATVISGGATTALPPVVDLEATVRDALAKPLGCPPVGRLVRPGARVVIAFDDPTVTSFGPVRRVVIEQALAELEAAGVDRGDVMLICANALHRKYRPEELAHLIGADLVREFGPRLISHDAEDADNLVHLGRTAGGYDVELSRYVVESDLTIYVNAAHNRGFAGGWKSVCVGLSSYRSIRHHHTPDGMSMSLSNNRMHAMLDEMGALAEAKIKGRIFKVDTIQANPLEVAQVFAGTVDATRKAAIEVLGRVYPPRRSLAADKFDALLYGVPDWSPYAIFSSMNPLLTLVSSGLGYLGGAITAVGKPGCTVIMVTPCPNRWDRVHHASYPDVWQHVLSRTRDPWEIAGRFAQRYATDGPLIEKYRYEYAFHPVHAILACYPLSRLRHIGRVLVVGAEEEEVVRHLGFEPYASLPLALARAQDVHGKDYRLGYVEQPPAPTKVPM
jgi:Lactate racemase N-terminal domain